MANFKPIDLSGLNDESKASSIRAQIAEACEKNGFFQVINHGVPVEFMEKLREVGHKFFDLSKEEKLAIAAKPEKGPAMGYSIRMVLTDSEPQHWRESVLIQTLPLSKREYPLWPQQPADFRETVEKYTAAVLDLTHRLLAVISENLGLKPTYLREAMGDPEIQQQIAFQCYPPCPDPGKTFGLHAHSDIAGISILMQESEGLQVVDENDTWELVPPYPNAFVVNLADQIEIITNGRYKSAQHRVIVNNQSTRRSYVTFYFPGMDHKIFPAPQLVDPKVGPAYKEFFYKEYLQALTTARVLGKRLIQSFAINNSVIN
ncbi:hypothetical protein O6H91_14G014800 [Diphasiastrum complanatum]|uniref:Uncharacterized protein n=1 Tax=Diphasiastrum complanatum TaxID=34168 RepID=A0ACC2BLN1_DIPCM|nr:hypothetical protein O6H91_14G014800 [Diphasiastrum complanatum]